ncbi:hypothetical protein SUGI_0139830 [Cryptomeria japonica]|nr:hypothetical protein SUGI_0139830 [Cryptomeria japonica]
MGSGWNTEKGDDFDEEWVEDKGKKANGKNPKSRKASLALASQDSFSDGEEGSGCKKRKKNKGNNDDSLVGSSLKEGNQEGLSVSEDSHLETGCDGRLHFPRDLNHDSHMLNLDREHPSDLLAMARNAVVDSFRLQKFFFHEINEINIALRGVKNKLDNPRELNSNWLEKGDTIRSSNPVLKVLRVMTKKFERAQEAKSLVIDIDVVDKGKQFMQEEGKGPCTRTRASSKKMVDQVAQDVKDMKKLPMNLSQLEVEVFEALKNLN